MLSTVDIQQAVGDAIKNPNFDTVCPIAPVHTGIIDHWNVGWQTLSLKCENELPGNIDNGTTVEFAAFPAEADSEMIVRCHQSRKAALPTISSLNPGVFSSSSRSFHLDGTHLFLCRTDVAFTMKQSADYSLFL